MIQQSFAVVGELGDVPVNSGCFQTAVNAGCCGQRGATEIEITDNDRKLLFQSLKTKTITLLPFSHTEMVNQSILRVSESMAAENNLFQPLVNVTTRRTSEQRHVMRFCYQRAASTATVEPVSEQTNPDFDAMFGARQDPYSPIQLEFDLEPGMGTVTPLTTFIRNEAVPERNAFR